MFTFQRKGNVRIVSPDVRNKIHIIIKKVCDILDLTFTMTPHYLEMSNKRNGPVKGYIFHIKSVEHKVNNNNNNNDTNTFYEKMWLDSINADDTIDIVLENFVIEEYITLDRDVDTIDSISEVLILSNPRYFAKRMREIGR